MKKILLLILILAVSTASFAQLSITAGGSSSTIDFSTTIADVNNGLVAGTGFASAPSSGQLDSDAFSTDGFDANVAFGASCSSGDCARGADLSGGVGTGGIYAFIVGSDVFLGVQPGGSDFTPGDITLAVTNNTGGDIATITLSFERWVRNDQDRANSFNVSVSTDDITYSEVSAFDYTSTAASDGNGFQATTVSNAVTLPATVANGGTFYIKWQGDDVSGSGSRDEFGIDDITITVPGLLPVEMTAFTARNINNTVSLDWATATEKNNSHFVVERSTNGRDFKAIATVEGNGTTVEPQAYNFVDAAPANGINYYRLKQVDFDGAFAYSDVVSIEIQNAKNDVVLLPNPVTADLNVQLPTTWTGETSIEIFDIAGRLVQSEIISDNATTFQLAGINNGQYIIRIINADNVITKRFVKQ